MSSDSSDMSNIPDTNSPAAIVNHLQKIVLSNQTSNFGGKIRLKDLPDSPSLYYQAVDSQDVRRAKLPLSEEDAKAIFESGTPSVHGHKGETVYDESYRLAREYKPHEFALSHDLLLDSDLISIIEKNINAEGHVRLKLLKLNAYGQGGFFKPHRDTPHSEQHIGSLVVCLPSQFTGGELVIRHDGCETPVDFTSAKSGKIAWVFLYSDCEHEVLPVISGTRITVAYDVILDSEPKGLALSEDLAAIEIANTIKRIIEAPGKKDCLAFALRHQYPSTVQNSHWLNRSFVRELQGRLKGVDASLHRAIALLKLKASYVALYNPEDVYVDSGDESKTDSDGGSHEDDGLDRFRENYYYSRTFHLEPGEDICAAILNGAERTNDGMIWVTKPEEHHFAVGTPYVSYGNEAQSDVYYTAVALLVTINE